MMWANQMSWFMWLLVGLGTLGFWVLIIMLVRAMLPWRPAAAPAPQPLRLLDERLARGEIDPLEYQQLRRQLTDGH